jgi:hypothetical protein
MADATTCRVGIDAVLLRELLYRVIVVAYDEERVRRSMAINDVIMYLNLLVLVEVGFGSILDVVVECEHGLTRIGHPHLCAHNETAVSSLGGDDASAKTEKRRRERSPRSLTEAAMDLNFLITADVLSWVITCRGRIVTKSRLCTSRPAESTCATATFIIKLILLKSLKYRIK